VRLGVRGNYNNDDKSAGLLLQTQRTGLEIRNGDVRPYKDASFGEGGNLFGTL